MEDFARKHGVRPSTPTAPVLRRERIIIVANREPFSHERQLTGEITVRHSTSGLVTASEPLVRQLGGVWIAHGSGTADRMVVDETDSLMVPPDHPAYRLRRLWLDAEEQAGYYGGFANEGLWPLCHRVHVRPVFRTGDFDTYWRVNERFADAACDEMGLGAPLVLVQDYHLALAPLLIRERIPDAAVTSFWHIPWPDVDRLAMCPWATYLVEGLLGGNLLGLQTAEDCGHFLDAAEHLLGATVERRRGIATWLGRRTHVRAYPASVTWPSPWLDAAGPVAACAREVRTGLHLRPADRLIVGVDRMDYTKGLEEKLAAFEQLLVSHPEFIDSVVFVQVAEPSREDLPAYRGLGERVRAAADAINQRFGTDAWRPVVLVETHQHARDVYRLLRAADVCYVGSLHDGMNLVAKEFVSARDDERGVLVLSQFAGASRELTEATRINPYDVEQCAHALADALGMCAVEQQAKLRSMRTRVAQWDAAPWATEILNDAAKLCPVPALDSRREALRA